VLARDSTIVRSWRHIALVSILRSSYALDAPLTSLSPSRRLTGGSAPGGALRGGRGCRRVRQAEIDDRERHRRGAALSCRVTRLSLWGGGAVRAGAAFASGRRRPGAGAWNRTRECCGPARPARLRGFRCAGSRPKTRGPFGQSESGSASLSIRPWTRSSKRSMDVHRSQMPPT
jgi:hypothetical protein